MKKGKHQAGGGWQSDPFAEETPSRRAAQKKPPASTQRKNLGDPFADDAPAHPKEKRKNHYGWNGMSTGQKVGIIAVCAILAVALLVVAWWKLFVKPPVVSENDRPGVSNNNPSINQGEPIDLDGDGEPDEVPTGRKEDYYTFLLIGRDTGGGGNTDTLILVSYDVPNGQVNMMSIPRDTAVNVSWSNKKINSVYNAKESSGGGIEGLKQQVAALTGVMPDRYVTIEWKAVGRIVKAVGGVEFDVPRNMNYDDPYQDLHIHINKGMQTLNSEQAMAMLRYRHDNDANIGYNDTGRMNTQRDFLKAMAKKVLQLGNITKIGEFIDIFMENVTTDLTTTELMWFASKALGVDVDTMQSSTLPYIDLGIYRGEYFFLPNGPEIVPLINEQFNPYNRDVQEGDLRIIVKNKDGSCYVPGGELLDSKWASPARSSSGTTGGGVSTTTPTGVTADPNVPTGSGGGQGSTPETSNPGGEPTLPPDENPTDPGTVTGPDTPADQGTATDPGSTAPDTPADPGTTGPGTDVDQGTAGDPGTGTEIDPGNMTGPSNTDPDPGTPADPPPAPQPDPGPAPELPPPPELPPED